MSTYIISCDLCQLFYMCTCIPDVEQPMKDSVLNEKKMLYNNLSTGEVDECREMRQSRI